MNFKSENKVQKELATISAKFEKYSNKSAEGSKQKLTADPAEILIALVQRYQLSGVEELTNLYLQSSLSLEESLNRKPLTAFTLYPDMLRSIDPMFINKVFDSALIPNFSLRQADAIFEQTFIGGERYEQIEQHNRDILKSVPEFVAEEDRAEFLLRDIITPGLAPLKILEALSAMLLKEVFSDIEWFLNNYLTELRIAKDANVALILTIIELRNKNDNFKKLWRQLAHFDQKNMSPLQRSQNSQGEGLIEELIDLDPSDFKSILGDEALMNLFKKMEKEIVKLTSESIGDTHVKLMLGTLISWLNWMTPLIEYLIDLLQTEERFASFYDNFTGTDNGLEMSKVLKGIFKKHMKEIIIEDEDNALELLRDLADTDRLNTMEDYLKIFENGKFIVKMFETVTEGEK